MSAELVLEWVLGLWCVALTSIACGLLTRVRRAEERLAALEEDDEEGDDGGGPGLPPPGARLLLETAPQPAARA